MTEEKLMAIINTAFEMQRMYSPITAELEQIQLITSEIRRCMAEVRKKLEQHN